MSASLRPVPGGKLTGVHLAGRPKNSLWDLTIKNGCIESIEESKADPGINRRLVAPSLCHPHIHLDKCFLLHHPHYEDLEINVGTFDEAMELTTKAKRRYTHEDLMERGRLLVQDSINYGVTHMRAFVEVDETVVMKCLNVGLALKDEFQERCHIQLCAFAQDPILCKPDKGVRMKALMTEAAMIPGVEVIGSTPYVESTPEDQKSNIDWMIDLALKSGKLLDFHLDYNLDLKQAPMIHSLLTSLKRTSWSKSRPIALGHCTRLTLFQSEEWYNLKDAIDHQPIHFIGLPTSDLFMMDRPYEGTDDRKTRRPRQRGTLQVVEMIKDFKLEAAIGINNVGNAFTPQGTCDPMTLASLGVGVYQAGSKQDATILMQCVSTRAKAAIGIQSRSGLELAVGDPADFVIFCRTDSKRHEGFRDHREISDVVYNPKCYRWTVYNGLVTNVLDDWSDVPFMSWDEDEIPEIGNESPNIRDLTAMKDSTVIMRKLTAKTTDFEGGREV